MLVANRGEIAIRVFRTLRELGIGTVGVYSEADRGSLHAALADEALRSALGPRESYLSRNGSWKRRGGLRQAIHPGYGFLAENAAPREGLQMRVWSGSARRRRRSRSWARGGPGADGSRGVLIIPGTTSPVDSPEDVIRLGEEYGWPVAIKASAGGGGKA